MIKYRWKACNKDMHKYKFPNVALSVRGWYLHYANGIQFSHVSGMPTVSGGLTGAIWRDPVKLAGQEKF